MDNALGRKACCKVKMEKSRKEKWKHDCIKGEYKKCDTGGGGDKTENIVGSKHNESQTVTYCSTMFI